MATSMLDSILGMVTPEMKQALAARLDEPLQAVQGGLGATTAATLGGLASKAGDTGFLGQILGLLGGGRVRTSSRACRRSLPASRQVVPPIW